jgi:hypothetical protein
LAPPFLFILSVSVFSSILLVGSLVLVGSADVFVEDFVMSPNGRFFAAACTNGDVHLLEAWRGQMCDTLRRTRETTAKLKTKMGLAIRSGCVCVCVCVCAGARVGAGGRFVCGGAMGFPLSH